MALPFSFLPYNDSHPVRYSSFPKGVVGLIALNTAIHIYLTTFPVGDRIGYWRLFGSVADHHEAAWGFAGFTAISSVFLHINWFHLVGNMVFLWTFGKRVEDACGTWRFLLFYLTAGIMGDLFTTLAHALGLVDNGFTSGIGASGAIAGVMGAYMILFPGVRISGCLFLFIIPIPMRMPAVVPLLIFLGEQLYFSYFVVTAEVSFGIGFLAHLGGFISAIFIFLYLRKDVLYRYWTRADL